MDLRESRSRAGVRHPWERARLSFLREVLARHGRLGARSVLDVGSGDAWLATELAASLPSHARFTCVDAAYAPTVVEGLSLPANFEARTELPTEGGFELVLALDVAEHVEDDHTFVRELARRLTPGGALLFTVPAWPGLFSNHDHALGHHRRYTHASARDLLASSGLEILVDGGFFHSLVAPRALALALEKLRRAAPTEAGPETEWRLGETSARIVVSVLGLEQRFTHALARRGVSLPGLSYYALAVRR